MPQSEQAKQSTASLPGAADPAAHDAQAKGAGVQALKALLAHGRPQPRDVVKLIDEHSAERDQMLALLHTSLGNAYVQQVMAAMKGVRVSVADGSVVQGDPGNPNSDYFEASAASGGAKWSEDHGKLTGSANGDGVDARYALGNGNSLHGTYDGNTQIGALGFEHNGRSLGELYGGSSDFSIPGDTRASMIDIGAREELPIGDGVGAIGYRHEMRTDATGSTNTGSSSNDGIAASWHDKATDANAYAARDDASGKFVGGASFKSQLDPSTAIHGLYDRGASGTSADLGISHTIDKENSFKADLGYAAPDNGKSATMLELEGRHAGSEFVDDTTVTVGAGQRDFFDVRSSLDARLGNNLYGGVSGRYHAESGLDPTGSVGASLTFTPDQKAALTVAGIVDEQGRLQTRLQLDLFKSKVDSVAELSAEKKSALVSLFASYSPSGAQIGSPGTQQNDEFGSPTLSTHSDKGRLTFGFKFSF